MVPSGMSPSDLHVPDAIAARLRADPSDALTLAVFTDWLEEHGYEEERTWLLDQRSDMAALFRPQGDPPDPLPGVPTAWIRMTGGLITGFRVPERRASMAVPTTQALLRSPLAVTLTSLVVPSGPDAAAWLPALRRLPHLRHIRLGAGVDPRLLEGFDALLDLEITTVLRPSVGVVALPALRRLALEVRGQRLDVLEGLAPPSVEALVLEASDWRDVPTGPLERFYERVEVVSLVSEGLARAVLPRPDEVQPRRSPET